MSYPSTVLAKSPIRFWRLNETSGTTATDSSTSGANGTYTPNSSGSWTGGTLNQTSPVTGGASALFNGSTGYVSTGDVPVDSLSHLTFEFGIKIANSGKANQMVWSKLDSGDHRIEVGTGNGSGIGQLYGIVVSIGNDNTGGGGSLMASGVCLVADTMHHVVVVYDGTLTGDTSRVKLYVDGSAVGLTNVGDPVPATLPAIISTESGIGVRKLTNDLFFEDYLTEVAIYNTSLSSSDVADNYAAFTGTTPPSFTASVPSKGDRINLTFDQSVSGVVAADYTISVGGIPVLFTVSGSGTAWTFILWRTFALDTDDVFVTYFGSGTVNGAALGLVKTTETATNSSAVLTRQRNFTTRELGTMITFSAATFGHSTYTATSTLNTIDISGLDVQQWIDVAVSSGARYATLTTKHDASWCLWPTASSSPDISTTAYGVAHPGADIVRDFTNACHAANLKVCLYHNFYDPTWLHVNGAYASGGYLAHVTTELTELLSNYGRIDALWIDTWNYHLAPDTPVGYTTVPYATISALVQSLQPGCVLLNNDHSLGLTESEIVVLEAPQQSIPSASNDLPTEMIETIVSNDDWSWNVASGDSLKDPYALLAKLARMRERHSAYELNITPNTSGVIPASQVAWMADFGEKIGIQGGAVFPKPTDVRNGVDRGDGTEGTLTGGGGTSHAFGF